jgi:hypothetical protein
LSDSILTSDDDALFDFIAAHEGDDPVELLLRASLYPGIDLRFAAGQIAARKLIRDKLPAWAHHPRLIFPSAKAAEQCSSEQTAAYKQSLISPSDRVCDLTGGLGADSYFLAQRAAHLTYVDRNSDCCRAAAHNFRLLGLDNIAVIEGEAEAILPQLPETDVFYVDPDRRPTPHRRVITPDDSEPNLPSLLPRLLELAPKVIAKLSPMVDIDRMLRLLPGTTGVHVLAVRNECKELLAVVERNPQGASPAVNCINFTSAGAETFVFDRQEEKNLTITHSPAVMQYIYEPNAAILKAGAFKSITRPGVRKLHPDSHCYTSDSLVAGFPGRTFTVDEVIPFSGSLCRSIRKAIPQANITVRNFPLTVEALRRRTGITDGGNLYLLATTLLSGQKVLLKLRPCKQPDARKCI